MRRRRRVDAMMGHSGGEPNQGGESMGMGRRRGRVYEKVGEGR